MPAVECRFVFAGVLRVAVPAVPPKMAVSLAALFQAMLLAPASAVQLPLTVFYAPAPPVLVPLPAPTVPGVMSQVIGAA
jgi:hypothetical protein